MYYHHCWACTEIYWHFRWVPRADREKHKELRSPEAWWHSTQVYVVMSRRGKAGAGPSAPWLTTQEWHWRGPTQLGGPRWSFPKPWRARGLQASCSIIRRNFIANKIHLKIHFNPACPNTDTVTTGERPFLWLHTNTASAVITILRYFHWILSMFLQQQQKLSWEPLSDVQWC